MIQIRANFLQPELFEYRFKRKPKNWTLDQIHDLWVRSSIRHDEQRFELLACSKEITSQIPKNDRGEHIVYFTKDGNLMSYKFTYHSEFKSYGVSTDYVKFSDDKVQKRVEKLDFLLANELAFELGQKYKRLNTLCSNKSWIVRDIMWRIIEERLREKFKKGNTVPPSMFILQISDRKYHVSTDDRYSHWYKFKLGEEYFGSSILI